MNWSVAITYVKKIEFIYIGFILFSYLIGFFMKDLNFRKIKVYIIQKSIVIALIALVIGFTVNNQDVKQVAITFASVYLGFWLNEEIKRLDERQKLKLYLGLLWQELRFNIHQLSVIQTNYSFYLDDILFIIPNLRRFGNIYTLSKLLKKYAYQSYLNSGAINSLSSGVFKTTKETDDIFNTLEVAYNNMEHLKAFLEPVLLDFETKVGVRQGFLKDPQIKRFDSNMLDDLKSKIKDGATELAITNRSCIEARDKLNSVLDKLGVKAELESERKSILGEKDVEFINKALRTAPLDIGNPFQPTRQYDMNTTLTKEEINKKIGISLKEYSLIKKYFAEAAYRIIKSEKKVRELLEIQLIRYLFTNDDVLANLEKYLGENEFTNIDVPIKRLATNFSEYYSVFAELTVAKKLKDEGKTDIIFIEEENNPDIQYSDNGIVQYAEVKNLEEIDPEFPILNNKLEAMSELDERYKKDFYIRLNDTSHLFNRIDDYKKALCSATDELIVALHEYLNNDDQEDLVFRINNFIFTVSVKSKRPEYFLMYSGDVMKFGSNKDIFLKMSSVYSRFINCANNGIKQLANKRGGSLEGIKNDRLYIFLNTGRNANFIPDELDKIISQMSKIVGIDDLVTLKIQP